MDYELQRQTKEMFPVGTRVHVAVPGSRMEYDGTVVGYGYHGEHLVRVEKDRGGRETYHRQFLAIL